MAPSISTLPEASYAEYFVYTRWIQFTPAWVWRLFTCPHLYNTGNTFLYLYLRSCLKCHQMFRANKCTTKLILLCSSISCPLTIRIKMSTRSACCQILLLLLKVPRHKDMRTYCFILWETRLCFKKIKSREESILSLPWTSENDIQELRWLFVYYISIYLAKGCPKINGAVHLLYVFLIILGFY